MFRNLQQVLRWRAPNAFKRSAQEHASSFDYAELASHCRTQNEFNRLHIELENVLTPLELADIAGQADIGAHPRPTHAWIEKIRKWTPQLFDTPQRYRRQKVSEHVILYQDPERPMRDKGLLLAFSGNARRLMVPVSVFLQFVDSCSWDVVVLRKDQRNSYLSGLGASADFPGLVEYVQAAVGTKAYQRVITLGTSAGGFFAAWAAVLMDAYRGISAGGGLPSTLPSLVQADKSLIRTRPATPREADLCFIYGRDHDRDHRSALLLLDLFGGRLLPIPDVQVHGVLGALLKRCELAAFMNEMLA